jgi:hypothetical protein
MAEGKSKFRQNVETFSWIVGIIVGLLVIWQTVSPMFAKKSTVNQKNDTTQNFKSNKTATNPTTLPAKPRDTIAKQPEGFGTDKKTGKREFGAGADSSIKK